MKNNGSTKPKTRTLQVATSNKAVIAVRPLRGAKGPQLRRQRASNNSSYLVGYGRPPKHSQFRPGQSGNPSGHRKKRDSLQDIVAQVLFEKRELEVGERTEKIQGVTALVRTAMTRALQGDYKFLMAVIALIRLSGLADLGGDALLPETDSRSDEAILADFLRRQSFSPKHSVSAEPKSTKLNSGEVDNDSE
jgi:hypothetical protein